MPDDGRFWFYDSDEAAPVGTADAFAELHEERARKSSIEGGEFVPPTPRWFPLKRHPVRDRLWMDTDPQLYYSGSDDFVRFPVIPAGRRSGKTEEAKRNLVRWATWPEQDYPDNRYGFGAPTTDQARQIAWKDLKLMVPRDMVAGEPREVPMIIPLVTGVELQVVGLDRPERIEGRPWRGLVIDEAPNVKEQAFSENVRPALSDRNGWCWLAGAPEGRANWFYDMNEKGLDEDEPEFRTYHWVSGDIVDPKEVEAARRLLDERTFNQEYNATFETYGGRAYYVFQWGMHVKRGLRARYHPSRNLYFLFDFNVSPGVAAVAQDMVLPNGQEGTAIIDEIFVPDGSDTSIICRELLDRWGEHKGRIYCYGDASGGNRHTSQTEGSDWAIIYAMLGKHYGRERVFIRLPEDRKNPPVRMRINSANARLMSATGIVRVMFDAVYAKRTARDFEGTQLLKGTSSEIDKKSNPLMTHLSDAVSYMLVYRWPVRDVLSMGFGSMEFRV